MLRILSACKVGSPVANPQVALLLLMAMNDSKDSTRLMA